MRIFPSLRRTAVALAFGLSLLATAESLPPPLDLPRASEGAPNVVVILLDDVGFGATSTFGGPARGGVFTLRQGERVVAQERVPATPPAYFSIDETFDVGVDTGSPAGRYPDNAPTGYPLNDARIQRVDIELR